MKKVRFQACATAKMNDSECHSPRPFLETRVNIVDTALCYEYTKPLKFSLDPLHRFETSNSSPYPLVNRTNFDESDSLGCKWGPSSELELSILDATCHEPRKPSVNTQKFQPILPLGTTNKALTLQNNIPDKSAFNVLTSIENTKKKNISLMNAADNSFFITKGNLNNFQKESFNNFNSQFKTLSLDKENNPARNELEMVKMGKQEAERGRITQTDKEPVLNSSPRPDVYDCSCHHCLKNVQTCGEEIIKNNTEMHTPRHNCLCIKPLPTSCNCNQCSYQAPHKRHTHCLTSSDCCGSKSQNTVDRKIWAIEKYEQSNNANCSEIQKQTNIKEKREPTVADLFKIIKLQNEQLQLLQEKVDKFISSGNSRPSSIPIQNYTTERVALETVNSEQHKISIGVMTSFEMVRTSTVINKEVVQQTENAQIQCNRSQLSIKEVNSKSPVNLNFLDGIAPVGNNLQGLQGNAKSKTVNRNCEEKTLNDFSLYNVHVDNATTPLMSPEQTLYLDVRDYSDSETGSVDQSNVGWTYYNKVMTHVNGMLQDSDMPSSASALYRNTRQQCLQMQIDKTNVSVTKRVKFGDDPLGTQQPHIYAATTDTSMKMNQLAAKYLKTVPAPPQPVPVPVAVKTSAPFDMSFATRNYMERHKLLQGASNFANDPAHAEIPKFLDITALKQQPKLL